MVVSNFIVYCSLFLNFAMSVELIMTYKALQDYRKLKLDLIKSLKQE